MSEAVEKILVIGPAWVGDMVMAQSLFRLLKQRDRDCSLTVMAPRWTRPLLERMPQVDHSLDLPFDHGELALAARRRLGHSLREQGYTRAIVLPNSFKSALIPFHARIPRRSGWRGEWRYILLNDLRRLDSEKLPLMVQRFAALGLDENEELPDIIPHPRLKIEEGSVTAAREKFGLAAAAKVVALCPGAEFGDSKQWPATHFAALANRLLGEGWQVWIMGSGNDRLVAEAILADIDSAHLSACTNLTGETSLAQAIDLLSLTGLVVTNDSGLMHIAAALDKRLVALYGSTSPDFTPPLAEKVKLLSTDIECRPCFKRECPYGHRRCLTDISPGRALSAVEELMAAP